MMNILSAPAQAGNDPMEPTEALSILVQARTLDARCGFLKGTAHDELAGYAARAEIVTAERMGTTAAENAVNRGMKAGHEAACNDDGKALVRDALAAAREAMRQARRTAPVRHVATRGTTAKVRPEHNVRLLPNRKATKEHAVALIDRKRSANFRPVARISGSHAEPHAIVVISRRNGTSRGPKTLIRNPEERYVAMTAEYYRQLRCGTANRNAMMRLYDRVRTAHYGLLRAEGPRVTARAKARARALAARRSCGVRIVRR